MDADLVRELRATLAEVFTTGSDAASSSAALSGLGWDEVAAEDVATTTPLLFEEQGRALGSSLFLDQILLARLTPDLASSSSDGAVVALPGPNGSLLVRGDPDRIGTVVAPVPTGSGRDGVALLARGDVGLAPVEGIDPAGRFALVSLPAPCDAGPSIGWAGALALARRALAAEQVGAGRAALQLGISHVSQRTQFGRPIGSFQAVRHRLAECHAELTAAATLVGVAFETEDEDDAMVAKVSAGRAADRTVRSVIQVSGAIGLTWEHRVHHYLRRCAALDLMAGSPIELETELGRSLTLRLASG